RLEHRACFQISLRQRRWQKIRADALPGIPRFADINHAVETVAHQVHTRLVRHFVHLLLEVRFFFGYHQSSVNVPGSCKIDNWLEGVRAVDALIFGTRRRVSLHLLYAARRRGNADCTIISSLTFSGVSRPTSRFMLSSTGTAGQLHSCMIRNASSKRVPVVTVGISRRITSPTRSREWSLRRAAIRSCRVSTPATFPVSSTTGKSC